MDRQKAKVSKNEISKNLLLTLEKKVKKPINDRVERIKPNQYCLACQALLKESLKELRGK